MSKCPRKLPFQGRCLDMDCDECEGVYTDLTFVWSLYVAPLLARSLLRVLPLKSASRSVETTGFGNISPEDIDWDKLERGASELTDLYKL